MALSCYHYKYNDTSHSSCNGSFEKCARLVECQSDGSASRSLCFALAKIDDDLKLGTNNTTPAIDTIKTTILSAGCYPHDSDQQTCGEQCLGNYRNSAGNYYCCCTERGCNERLVPKQFPPPLPSPVNATLSISQSSTNGDMSETFLSSNQSVMLVVVSLALVVTIAVGLYCKRSRLKRYLSSGNNNDRGDHHQLNTRTANTTNHKSNNSNNNNIGNDVSVLMPFRNSFNDDNNYQYGQQNLNENNNINLDSNNYASRANHNNPINSNSNYNNHRHQKFDLKDVELLALVGSGRFGTVHKANLVRRNKKGASDNNNSSNNNNSTNRAQVAGDNLNEDGNVDLEAQQQLISSSEIAVKIIPNSEYQSWQNELSIYSSSRTRHPNILTFLGTCESPQTNSNWLLVEYASNGSLHHYLKANPVTWEEFLRISLGIVRGLSHLHDADIAHRDFKSKNVLLRHNLSPCLTDFGVASMLDITGGSHTEQRKKYLQMGTPRYMAPEVLECSVAFTKISFTKIDVYALSLVLWELLSRCHPLPKLRMLMDYDESPMAMSFVRPFENVQPYIAQSSPLGQPPPPVTSTPLRASPKSTAQQQPDETLELGSLHQQAEFNGGGASGESLEPHENHIRPPNGLGDSSFSDESNQLQPLLAQPQADEAPPYRMPYEDVVGPNPDINTMRQAVAVDKIRPPIRPEWRFYPIAKLCRAIIDGWEYDHDARISASCLEKRIETLIQQQKSPPDDHMAERAAQPQPQQIATTKI